MAFGFGRERRIRRRVDFLRVQTHGERASSRHFVLLVAAREVASMPSRLGVVATRKVGNATRRNRIKRLCRECFRLWPGFVPDGVDLVVIAREGADTLSLDRVRDEWGRARPTLLKRCEAVLRHGPVGLTPKDDIEGKAPTPTRRTPENGAKGTKGTQPGE
jgi:ribonuclease P protein component